MRERLVSQRTGIVNQIRAFDLRTIRTVMNSRLISVCAPIVSTSCHFPSGTLQKKHALELFVAGSIA